MDLKHQKKRTKLASTIQKIKQDSLKENDILMLGKENNKKKPKNDNRDLQSIQDYSNRKPLITSTSSINELIKQNLEYRNMLVNNSNNINQAKIQE